MRKLLFATLAISLLLPAVAASATTYTYVGSFVVGDGADWTSNPLAYSGLGAAALIFGGNPSDYAISTVDSNPADINFLANYDIIGIGSAVFAQDFFRGIEGTTHYQDVYEGDPDIDTVSTFVNDGYDRSVNYVFAARGTSPVPEPGSLALLSTGLLGVGATVRRRFSNR